MSHVVPASMVRPRRQSPTSTSRHLSALLVLARKEAGLTQERAAKGAAWSKRKHQMVETAEVVIADADLDVLLELYGVPERQRPAWHELAAEARARGWWDRYETAALPEDSKRYLGLEQGATRMRVFEPLLIHGLLQTPAYREVVMTAASTTYEPVERVAALLEISRRRQEALHADEPLELWAVLDEAALHRGVGTPQIMREQLTHLVDTANEHEHVTVQVIPFEAGPHPGLNGSFAVMEFGWPDDPGLVYVEAANRPPDYLASLGDVWNYAGHFNRLVSLALSPSESLEMLHEFAQRLPC